MMWCPSMAEILLAQQMLVSRFGGTDGVRSLPLIESALQRFHAFTIVKVYAPNL